LDIRIPWSYCTCVRFCFCQLSSQGICSQSISIQGSVNLRSFVCLFEAFQAMIALQTLQGNNGRIDRNMSESKCPKLQKIDRKLSKMTESWQKNVRIDSNLSKVTKICQFSVTFP
jgi:hypothetical protein